jgi:hypothetical protein
VLIKPFSSEAAPFSFYPSGLLPGLVEPKPPHRATAKISRRQSGNRQDKNTRALASRTTTSAPAAVHRCLQSVSGLASSPAPPVGIACCLVLYFFLGWRLQLSCSLLWGFIELARGACQALVLGLPNPNGGALGFSYCLFGHSFLVINGVWTPRTGWIVYIVGSWLILMNKEKDRLFLLLVLNCSITTNGILFSSDRSVLVIPLYQCQFIT